MMYTLGPLPSSISTSSLPLRSEYRYVRINVTPWRFISLASKTVSFLIANLELNRQSKRELWQNCGNPRGATLCRRLCNTKHVVDQQKHTIKAGYWCHRHTDTQ